MTDYPTTNNDNFYAKKVNFRTLQSAGTYYWTQATLFYLELSASDIMTIL
jgi:hypothetical protein